MIHNEKLYALIGIVGKAKVAEYLNMTSPTFLSRLNNPGDWKIREIEALNKMYEETFNKKQ